MRNKKSMKHGNNKNINHSNNKNMNQNVKIKNEKIRKHKMLQDIKSNMNDEEKEEIRKHCFKV